MWRRSGGWLASQNSFVYYFLEGAQQFEQSCEGELGEVCHTFHTGKLESAAAGQVT